MISIHTSSRAQSNIEIEINSTYPKYLLFDESPVLFDCNRSRRLVRSSKVACVGEDLGIRLAHVSRGAHMRIPGWIFVLDEILDDVLDYFDDISPQLWIS